jgi:predicted DNA-binding protein
MTSCVVCGKGFHKLRNRKTCSDECSTILNGSMRDYYVRITKEQSDRLEELSQERKKTVSQIVREAIEKHISDAEYDHKFSTPKVLRTRLK